MNAEVAEVCLHKVKIYRLVFVCQEVERTRSSAAQYSVKNGCHGYHIHLAFPLSSAEWNGSMKT